MISPPTAHDAHSWGANPDVPAEDAGNRTALHLAAYDGHVEASPHRSCDIMPFNELSCLLVRWQSLGWLQILQVVGLLLEAGADANAQCTGGRATLFFQQCPFSICWSTPTLPILSNSVYCCSFRVANCAGTAKDIVSQRHRCLPHIEATGWSKLIEVMRHIVSRSEGLQCYQMLPIDNGKHCLFLSQTCLCKTVVGSKSGGLEEVMERRTCFAAMWQDLRQLRPFWRFPSHLPQLFHLALPGHR